MDFFQICWFSIIYSIYLFKGKGRGKGKGKGKREGKRERGITCVVVSGGGEGGRY